MASCSSVKPAQPGRRYIFAHVRAFPRELQGDGFYGILGEAVSFEIEYDPDRRKRATRIQLCDEVTPEVEQLWT